jgi:hypothetical protein
VDPEKNARQNKKDLKKKMKNAEANVNDPPMKKERLTITTREAIKPISRKHKINGCPNKARCD